MKNLCICAAKSSKTHKYMNSNVLLTTISLTLNDDDF